MLCSGEELLCAPYTERNCDIFSHIIYKHSANVFSLKRKIKLLERKLLEEEHERRLMQEKAEEVRNQHRSTEKISFL